MSPFIYMYGSSYFLLYYNIYIYIYIYIYISNNFEIKNNNKVV